MEAVWKIEVEDFPAFIVVDDKGNDFFQEPGPGADVHQTSRCGRPRPEHPGWVLRPTYGSPSAVVRLRRVPAYPRVGNTACRAVRPLLRKDLPSCSASRLMTAALSVALCAHAGRRPGGVRRTRWSRHRSRPPLGTNPALPPLPVRSPRPPAATPTATPSAPAWGWPFNSSPRRAPRPPPPPAATSSAPTMDEDPHRERERHRQALEADGQDRPGHRRLGRPGGHRHRGEKVAEEARRGRRDANQRARQPHGVRARVALPAHSLGDRATGRRP